ncbi:MAG: glycosyltransferase [Acholeplasmataceae bacterium]|nr:glycosyltransferase [Acholeplasmataceae bacterium]
MKKKVLIILGRYLPGYKDGGPVRSIINLVDSFHVQFDFHILTKDRDQGDTDPYSHILYNEWNTVGNAKVYYAQNEKITKDLIVHLSKPMDVIYVCGVFNDYVFYTLILKMQGRIQQKVVVAPMGSFSTGAFQIKSTKKKLYISMFRMLGLFKNVEWSLTSEMEVRELHQIIKNPKNVVIAEDLPRMYVLNLNELIKEVNSLNVVFISRVSVKKNLTYAIDILSKVKGNVKLSIYGNIEDSTYWNTCLEKLALLPNHISWEYLGEAPSENILSTFSKYHAFLFPTLSENYGHVIYEALASGCIPVISNQTPWQDFDAFQCGYVIKLENLNQFVYTMQTLIDMNQIDFDSYRNRALQYAVNKYHSALQNSGYLEIFETR